MAIDNRTLGRFDLVGIPAAPRGIPQIEVSFDIDANGIVHVSAKDLGTGKEQSIRIQSSSGLSDEEIDKMVKDAESHAEEDRGKEELIKAKNEADQLVYTTEKTLKEHGDKLSEDEKKAVNEKIEALKAVMTSDNAENINKAKDELMQASHKLAEEMYKHAQAQQQQAGAGTQPGPQPDGDGGQSQTGDNGAVDADFEVVDDKDK